MFHVQLLGSFMERSCGGRAVEFPFAFFIDFCLMQKVVEIKLLTLRTCALNRSAFGVGTCKKLCRKFGVASSQWNSGRRGNLFVICESPSETFADGKTDRRKLAFLENTALSLHPATNALLHKR